MPPWFLNLDPSWTTSTGRRSQILFSHRSERLFLLVCVFYFFYFFASSQGNGRLNNKAVPGVLISTLLVMGRIQGTVLVSMHFLLFTWWLY